jgi:hypothetical protein
MHAIRRKVLILMKKKNVEVLNSKTESRRDFDSESFALRSQTRGWTLWNGEFEKTNPFVRRHD